MERVRDKCRKEKRKEARLAKQKNRFLSWAQHQSGKKKKNMLLDLEPPSKEVTMKKKSKKSDYSKKRKKSVEGKPKTKFQEFLQMERANGVVSMEEDLEMERRLAKKLKVKGGKLSGLDDGIDMLIEGVPSVVDSVFGDEAAMDDEVEEDDGEKVANVLSGKKKRKRKKSSGSSGKQLEDESADKFPAGGVQMESRDTEQIGTLNEEKPHLEEPAADAGVKYMAPHLVGHANSESEELARNRRRVRGLLNRLSESNVESITEEVASIFRSVSRSVGCQMIGEEVLASCSRGPRGNEQEE